MDHYQLDIVAMRGGVIESQHSVHAAVVDATGTLVGMAHSERLVTIWRSCAKPFQVLPLLESGHFDGLGWGEAELALACASHGGEPEHVAIARRMLESIGLEEGDLACGPHEPLSRRGARLLQQSGDRLTRLHNNCSGKHAAMLALAIRSEWPALGYESCSHPVQQQALERVSKWTGVPAGAIGRTTDGCGVVAFALPLEAMARAFALLGAAAQQGDELPARIIGSMRARPILVGGTDRFDSVLIEETDGYVIAKVGAEGVHSFAIPSLGLGCAVKAADGATRAQHPAVLRLLQYLGALPETLPPRLSVFMCTPIQNTRGEVVGEIRPLA